MRNINMHGAKFIVSVWGGEGWYVIERRGFGTLEGAMRFASDFSLRDGVRETSITVKDKASGPGRVRRLTAFRNGRQLEKAGR